MKTALVIGGLKKYVEQSIAPKLARYGISVGEHWPMDHVGAPRDPPAGTEVVILFREMCPQPQAMGAHMTRWCKKAGVPFVSTGRKAAFLYADLSQAGFAPCYPATVAATPAPAPEPAPAPLPEELPTAVADTGALLPTWIMQAVKDGVPIEVTPERDEELFRLGADRTFTVLCRITPQVAERWLDRNKCNRALSERRGDMFAAAFRRGEYRLTHQGLAFGRNSYLQDGQHRLWGAATAPATIDVFVTFGQMHEALAVIDDVNRRKVWQNRQILSTARGCPEANSKRLAEMARVISIMLADSLSEAACATTYDEIDSIIHLFDGGIVWAAALPSKRIFMPATVRAALAFAHKSAPEKVAEFAQQVLEGERLSKGMPAYALRAALASKPAHSGTERRDQCGKALTAIFAHLRGAPIYKLNSSDEALVYFGRQHGFKLRAARKPGAKEEPEESAELEQAVAPAATAAVPPIVRKRTEES